MSTLSPQAQATWDAFNDAYETQGPLDDMARPLAAALRAAAEQVVPPPTVAVPFPNETTIGAIAKIRRQILAIAAELDPGDGVEVGEQ